MHVKFITYIFRTLSNDYDQTCYFSFDKNTDERNMYQKQGGESPGGGLGNFQKCQIRKAKLATYFQPKY